MTATLVKAFSAHIIINKIVVCTLNTSQRVVFCADFSLCEPLRHQFYGKTAKRLVRQRNARDPIEGTKVRK